MDSYRRYLVSECLVALKRFLLLKDLIVYVFVIPQYLLTCRVLSLGLFVIYSQSKRTSTNPLSTWGEFCFFLQMETVSWNRNNSTYNKWSACQHVLTRVSMYLSFTGSSNMVTGETKSFFSFAKSVSVLVLWFCSTFLWLQSFLNFISIMLLLLILLKSFMTAMWSDMFYSDMTARQELELCAVHI